MDTEHNFLITYGLHNFVTHTQRAGKHIFTIRTMESQKMISHARSLIAGNYRTADIRVGCPPAA
ncbi:MAG: hypothetical protein OQK24_06220 [Magnetovibrio sp.]|nr:hypothetical protein [Magnetovibrio sp.]